MATRAKHLEQARSNLQHAEWLLSVKEGDPTAVRWAVTAVFYCAMHCIEAHFADRGIHCATHFERGRAMRARRAGVPREVRTHYDQLKDWSEQARYYGRSFWPEMVRQIVLGQYLPVVKRLVGL